MFKGNYTSVKEFILLGFQDLHSHSQCLIFLFLLFMYVITMTGNSLIIALVASNIRLRSPMYFFLSHLSFCDILISTNVVPNALQVILKGFCPIPALSCHTQSFFFGASVITECCLLSVMSYDRYLAICVPLYYYSIMKHNLPKFLALLCWMVGFTLAMIIQILILELIFCGPNIIDHFFCDLSPVLELACSNTKKVEILVSITVLIIGITQFLFVVVTYICIFTSILQISSILGRRKLFSTCSSHLGVVSTFYGTLITLYMAPTRGYSLNLNKALSLLNSVITPSFNPVIYSLRNKEIRNAISRTVNSC